MDHETLKDKKDSRALFLIDLVLKILFSSTTRYKDLTRDIFASVLLLLRSPLSYPKLLPD